MPWVQRCIVVVLVLITYSCASSTTGLRTQVPPSPFTKYKSEPPQAIYLQHAIETMNTGKGDEALLILRQVSEQNPNTPWYQRALFLSERVQIQMDRSTEADATMLRILSEHHNLADYAIFLLADYHYAHERYTRAAALHQTIIEKFPTSPLFSRSLLQRGQALLEAQAYKEAEEVFEKILNEYSSSDVAPAAGLGLGRALSGQARFAEAIRAYQNVQINYAGNAAEQDVDQELADLKAADVNIPIYSADDLYKRGKNLFKTNQYGKASETLTKLLQDQPQFVLRSEVQLMCGIAAFNIGRRNESVAILEKMIRQYPADQRIPEALIWLGKAYSKLGEWEKGIKTFQKIINNFPESEWADDALYYMGNIYRETGDVKKSFECYGRLASEYPQSNLADSALWWRAWTSYTAGDFQRTEQTLRELVNRYPRSFLVNQARYWQGRVAEKLGDVRRATVYYEEVLKRGPYTFYGYRAAEALDSLKIRKIGLQQTASEYTDDSCREGNCQNDQPRAIDVEDSQPVWTEETRALLAAEPSFRKILELTYVGLKKDAAAELWLLQGKIQHKRGANIGLSKAFYELGDYYRSFILVLKKYERYLEAPKDGTPDDLWRLAYPQAYWDYVIAYAQRYKQDPYFIAAIMREESQFKADALSPAGARGLMQVMPATGSRIAQQIKIPDFNGLKLYDAETGINIGTWYVGNLMKQFKGDPLLVAAAYNAGPDAVSSWIKKNKENRDRDFFVESIPFMETRGYVKKVLRNYAEYKRIYGKSIDTVPGNFLFPVDTAGSSETHEKPVTP